MEKTPSEAPFLRFFSYGLCALFVIVLYRTAWLSDDIYITYRCIENFVLGHGFTFNPGQRVQAFTHPLWAILHIPFRFVFADMYYMGLFLSILTSLAAVFVAVFHCTKRKEVRVLLLLALISSSAFVDFSTSGLENPLTHLLVLLIAHYSFQKEPSPNKLWYISLLSGLVLLNRMDSILLVAPLLAWTWWEQRSLRTGLIVFAGLSPFFAWELFSLCYYGFPFPMTAYAKLNVHLAPSQLLIQGGYYFQDLLKHDPLTALLLGAGIVLPLMRNEKIYFPLIAGICLFLAYILYIGGDFMRGRFFTAPFVLSLFVLSKLYIPRKNRDIGIGIAVISLGLLGTAPPILSHSGFGKVVDSPAIRGKEGISNEREFYFQGTGLIAAKGRSLPHHKWVDIGKAAKQNPDPIFLAGTMGFIGYYAGPQKYIVDQHALTDPFLAHLPSLYRLDWRPGHNQRLLLNSYLKSLIERENLLEDPGLRDLYAAIELICRGPLWDRERWGLIWKINATSSYQKRINTAYFTLPIKARYHESELASLADSTWNVFMEEGIEVKWDSGKRLLWVELQSGCPFHLLFRKGNEIIDGRIIDVPNSLQEVSSLEIAAPLAEIDNLVVYSNEVLNACQLQVLNLVYEK